MSGLVDQLQADSLDPKSSISALLRKVKIAAVKLSLPDALEWVQRELDGYKDRSDLPSYREARGNPVAWNPYHGWQPLMFGDDQINEMLSEVTLFDPIGVYESLFDESTSGSLLKPINPSIVTQMNSVTGWDIPKAAIEFPRGVIGNVIEQVRNMILDWSLELARAGITGEGLSFTMEERSRAAGAHIHIGQLNGSFSSGDVVGNNARVNHGSEDRSHNNVSSKSVFRDIENAARSGVPDGVLVRSIIDSVKEMEGASDKTNLLSAYQRFIGLTADHIGVFAPMLPALAALIAS
ncbi:hypothetical protein HL653_02620 [Sphingomonas sp. AP4-R1]|uniref:AbiTii domain-containing protein n=1 Tax=Sphingomonas sp. AP4-R1 TaxID=2735134 RepID=UPI001493C06A|nr:hypothetical protein [Sphingomonas sp. AP4-R1]QJU56828.1 hypothetical protein HL653_02620 [Sphingomonas sp. AP4-R1]